MVSDNCTASLTNLQDLAISVTDVNDAPAANADNYEVKENQKLSANVLTNDSDEDGNTLSIDINPVQPPHHGTLVLSSNGDFTYQPLIDYLGNDTFTYQVCDNGVPALCSVATVSITIVKDDNCQVFVPNAFSPNGDGIHDYFKIRCLYNYENPIIEIYNRWGNLVYKKDHYGNLDFWGTDADAFWNGNSDQKGNLGSKELPVGTYYYILKLNNSNVLTGFLFLNR
jgi:gliding motility-associated-like protein